ncbi:TonB-dependent receptor domain-containing protein [Halomonas halocynthiae]|uniref:TonB-dependent receptor domain-containing protein n=1 Tax=Halomonas halocynthiae TaxID=176290 RepID=UPI00047F9DF1|nr:TonB-dependent receptor [Halomonas halocynthiae]
MNVTFHGTGWLALMYCATFLPTAFADTPASAPSSSTSTALASTPQPDILVTGTRHPGDVYRTPMIIDVIDRSDPELATATRWEDALSQQPGIHVSGSGRRNGQFLSMRGFGKNGVQVRLDGVRQDINTGHIGNYFADPALIKEIQIARGALSSFYGSNAMGGVVSLSTIDADDLLAAGENGGVRLSASAASAARESGAQVTLFGRQGVGVGKRQGLVSLGYSNSGDIRRAGGQEAKDDASLRSLLAKGSLQLAEDHQLSASWQHYDERAHQPANPELLVAEDDSGLVDRDVKSDNVQLLHRWQPAATSRIDNRLSLSRQDIDSEDSSRTLTRYGLQSDGYHHLNHGWLAQTLSFGAELERAEQRPGGSASGFPDADIDTAALYVDDTLTAGDYISNGGAGEFDLGLGVRYDRYRARNGTHRESKHDHASPKVRLSWRPSSHLMLYTGYAEAFRAPTLSELYADERHFSGFCAGPFFCAPDNFWVPNPGLKPETSKTWESGFNWQINDWSLRASYFDTDANDFIDSDVDLMAGTTQAVNVSRAKLWGYDLRLGWQPEAITALSASAGVSEVSGRDRATDEGLQNQTPLEATLGVDWHVADANLTLGWRGRFAQSFDKTDAGRLPGYGLNDLHLGWQATPAFTASLRLANLADQVWYRPDGSLGSGRNLLANFSYQW